MLLTIITFVIVLSVLVFAHELGHFMVARKFGVKAEEFGFGFPPRIFGVYRSKEGKWKKVMGAAAVEDAQGTVYSINWIPLGGFVKIKGENGDSDDPDSFINKKIWKRAFILSAGVLMNIVLAAILISAGFMIGLPQSLDNVDSHARVSDRKIQVLEVIPDSPAAKAGVAAGDTIVSIDDKTFPDYQELQKYVDQNTGKVLDYQVDRGQQRLDLKIAPQFMKESGRGGIGVAITETGIVRYSFFYSLWAGIKETAILTWFILTAFYQLLKGLFVGHGVSADLAGPVGIAVLTGQVARMGIIYVLQFTAMLSINLAIINFIPFPALDGGRVLFLVIEKVKGAPVKRELEAIIHNIGFALLMILVLIVTFRDVARFGDKFRMLWERIIG